MKLKDILPVMGKARHGFQNHGKEINRWFYEICL